MIPCYISRHTFTHGGYSETRWYIRRGFLNQTRVGTKEHACCVTLGSSLLPAAAEFLHQKKLVQVNGTHTALAFTTLCEAAIKDFEGNLAVDLHELPLRPVEDMSATHAEQMWKWVVCEALELLLDHGLDVAKRAYGVNAEEAEDGGDAALVTLILNDARVALDRLSSSAKQDTVGRVLNAGVMLRLEGRLKTVNDKLQREIAGGGANMQDAHALLLSEAGLSGGLEELGLACDTLFWQCARVAKFVAEEPESMMPTAAR